MSFGTLTSTYKFSLAVPTTDSVIYEHNINQPMMLVAEAAIVPTFVQISYNAKCTQKPIVTSAISFTQTMSVGDNWSKT